MIVEFVDSVENGCLIWFWFLPLWIFYFELGNLRSFRKSLCNVPVGVAPSRRCSRPRARTPPPRPMLKAVVVVVENEATFPNSIVENAGAVTLQSPDDCWMFPIAVDAAANECTKALVDLECKAATQKATAVEIFRLIILSVKNWIAWTPIPYS